MLTRSDKSSIAFFWDHNGDPTSWCFWEEKWPDIQKELPHVAKAWTDYQASRKILDVVMKNLAEENQYE